MRLSLLLPLLSVPLLAQVPEPPAIQDLMNLPTVPRLQPMPVGQPPAVAALRMRFQEPPQTCSIPLLNMLKRDTRDRIAIPLPRAGSAMPVVKLPAPPCDDTKR